MRRAAALLVAAALAGACGKKGPPLPPLVKLPVAPAEFAAARRGDTVALRFKVPAANTDGTRPANVDRVDVYAFTGPSAVTDAQILKHGVRIGSVPVKRPVDPNDAETPEESDEPAPVEGTGLDQGAVGHAEEALTAESLTPIDLSKEKKRERKDAEAFGPLLGPPPSVPSRTYVSLGINTHGKKGPLSNRVAVPLVAPPAPPSAPTIAYDEKEVTLTWSPPPGAAVFDGVLPSHPIGGSAPALGYYVYELPSSTAAPGGAAGATRLTTSPVDATSYVDARIAWGVERCYAVRAVETIGPLSVESAAAPSACQTFVDTFPPAAPTGLTAVASQGAISLIWQANAESDLAGYVVLRGVAPSTELTPMMTAPIEDTTFRDTVRPGVRYVYAVRAVDKAGNLSPLSNRVEETAR